MTIYIDGKNISVIKPEGKKKYILIVNDRSVATFNTEKDAAEFQNVLSKITTDTWTYPKRSNTGVDRRR